MAFRSVCDVLHKVCVNILLIFKLSIRLSLAVKLIGIIKGKEPE